VSSPYDFFCFWGRLGEALRLPQSVPPVTLFFPVGAGPPLLRDLKVRRPGLCRALRQTQDQAAVDSCGGERPLFIISTQPTRQRATFCPSQGIDR
jgi:hypothetical protein